MNYSLCDTFGTLFTYEDYKEDCEANGIEPCEDESYAFYDWQTERGQEEYSDLMENLKYSKYNDTNVVISGTLGLWNGRHEIEEVEESSITDAIQKCVNNMDDVVIRYVDGTLEVAAYHHDGVNNFVIAPCEGKFPDYLY